jgi:hypothetical protein
LLNVKSNAFGIANCLKISNKFGMAITGELQKPARRAGDLGYNLGSVK